MRTLLSVALLALPGCQWLLGGDASECGDADDCPMAMTCEVGRCVPDTQTPIIDAAPLEEDGEVVEIARDIGVVDQGPVDAQVDAALVDAALPAEIDPPFADGRCFDGAGQVDLPPGDTLVPRGLCTPYGVLWTRSGPDGAELVVSRTVPVEPLVVLPISADARVSTRDGRLVAYRSPDATGRAVPTVLDLAAQRPTPTVIRPLSATEAIRGNGLTTYVHDGGVVVHPDAEAFGTFVECAAPGRIQWGPAVSGSRIAFFERGAGGGAQVVLADLATCRNRVILPTRGTVDGGARVHRVGERWVWIARDADGPAVHGVAPDARGRLRPLRQALEHAPLELAGEGDWLVAVAYDAGAYRIDALNLAQNRYRPLSDGASNHRRPLVWNGLVTWAAMSRQRWGVQYVPLDR